MNKFISDYQNGNSDLAQWYKRVYCQSQADKLAKHNFDDQGFCLDCQCRKDKEDFIKYAREQLKLDQK